jgi:diguanylate cyclase (GGDEF)-like protein/PAS domain S-box-containing protein
LRGVRLWRQLGLLGQFTAIGLTITCGIVVVLGLLLGRQLETATLDQAAEVAADLVRRQLDQSLRPEDFTGPLSPDRYAAIDRLVHDRLLGVHAVRVRIWNAHGQVLYADDGEGVGEIHLDDEELSEALLKGQVVRELLDVAKENRDFRAAHGRLMEIYVPIKLDGQHVIGAYEVYNDLLAVEPYVGRMQWILWVSLILAFDVLYLALFRIVRRASQRLRRQEERLGALVGNAADVIIILDRAAQIQYQSPAVQRAWGYERGLLADSLVVDLVHPDDHAAAHELLAHATSRPGANVETELRVRHADGTWRVVEVIATNLLNDPVVAGVVVTFHDITERKAFEQQLTRLAFHDPLTGLPNRALFLDRLDRAIARADRYFRSVGVLFIDLDNFKVVNDSLGHDAGDRLLVTIAQRLQEALRGEDSVARLGGDEFTVLIEDVTDQDAVMEVAERTAQAVRAPVILDGREVYPSASVGVALSVTGHDDHDSLLRNADLAMYRAKANGKGCIAVFDLSMNAMALERLEIEGDLRHAVERGEFRVVYQPIVSIETGRVTELEALVRWEHPQHGLLSPARFVPVAEETGLIVPIGQWVLEQACQQAAAWQGHGPDGRGPIMSVNLSARQFQHPSLVEDIARILFRSQLDPESLKLEVTESAVMSDPDEAAKILCQLKGLGIQIAIDDFGTGYSSLNYLKQFPVDTLKIDRSFVDGLGRDANDAAIVQSIIALARSLQLTVTGEGIETTEQLAELQALGCDRGQGYHFARPLTPELIPELLEAGRLPGQVQAETEPASEASEATSAA